LDPGTFQIVVALYDVVPDAPAPVEHGSEVPVLCRWLAGTMPVHKAVDTLVGASRKDNADPKRCRADFVCDSEDPEKHRMNLLSFGWGNCVNDTIAANVDYDRRFRIGNELIKRYKVKESCDN
jgi:hypothetical protein